MPMEFIQNNIITIAIAIISGVMLVWPSFRRGGKIINPPEATLLINREEALVVDVRTSGEFAGGAAPGSLNIPLDQLPHRLDELPKDRPLVLCCATGARSQYAKLFLERSGFPEVHNAGPWQACR